MFITTVAPAEYTDPWSSDFHERFAALNQGDRRVAYFYEEPDTSTFRYRVYNMIQALESLENGTSAAYFSNAELDRMDDVVDSCDTLVICRTRYTDQINRIITRAKSKGKLVLFDTDDFVFDCDYVHLILHTLDQDLTHPNAFDHWFAYVGRMGATLKLCDGVIVTNEYLASRVRDFAAKETHVIPNFLNRGQLAISRRIYEEKVASEFRRDGQINLGYFSGTPTHNRDFQVASGALARLMREDSRLTLRVVGFLEPDGALSQFVDRIEMLPLQDFLNLQRLIGETEINIVPLQDNIFTNCKSELKYFEAAIVGTVTVASPTFTFQNTICDRTTGYLANAQQWDEILGLAVDCLDDPGDVIRAAHTYAESNRSYTKFATAINRTLFE